MGKISRLGLFILSAVFFLSLGLLPVALVKAAEVVPFMTVVAGGTA
jgi:hypothetical protein